MKQLSQRQQVGAKMRDAASAAGVSAEKVAETLGVKSETVYRYYGGQIEVSEERLKQFADLVGQPTWIFHPEERFEEMLGMLETVVRHERELPSRQNRRLNEILVSLSELLGPLPDPKDDDGWRQYLADLGSKLRTAYTTYSADISQIKAPGVLPNGDR